MMTTQDEQAFLTAIHSAPDDDTPRLVFADWLDERGSADDKARAALIRAQCQREYLTPTSKEWKRLEREAKAIIKANGDRWLKPLRAAKLGTNYEFRRGFLDGLSISSTTFVKRGKELFQLAPTLRTVRFPNAANEVTRLAASPYLARLVSADLTRMCTCGYCSIDKELRNLFKSKHATNLRHLVVARDRIDADVALALARSANLANLTTLDLSDNPLGGDGVAALAESKRLGNIRTLNLSRTNIPRTRLQLAGIERIAAAKHFTALTHLALSGNRLTGAGVAAIVAAPFFGQLTHLDLSKNRIGEVGAQALANAKNTKLESLDLTGSQLGARLIEMLKAKFGKKVKV